GDLLEYVRVNVDDQNSQCAFWAAWSGTLLGEVSCRKPLETFAKSADSLGDEAVALLMTVLPDPDAVSLYEDLVGNSALLRRGLLAAGVLGRTDAVQTLIEHMSTPILARGAGEAFTRITGIRIVNELECAEPAATEDSSS